MSPEKPLTLILKHVEATLPAVPVPQRIELLKALYLLAVSREEQDRLRAQIHTLQNAHALPKVDSIDSRETTAPVSPKPDSIGSRETRTVASASVGVLNTLSGKSVPARTFDERGVPVIPGLADEGMIVFYDLWKQIQDEPMDEAVSRLDGVLELSRHHPALAPEMAALAVLVANWFELAPVADTRRLSMFELSLSLAREQAPAKAVVSLQAMRAMYGRHADLGKEMEQIGAVLTAWESLTVSAVFERGKRL